jgi:hypothetical protein
MKLNCNQLDIIVIYLISKLSDIKKTIYRKGNKKSDMKYL